MDKHRLLIIVMTRLVESLMRKAKEAVGQQSKAAESMLQFVNYAFDEYCLQPIINYKLIGRKIDRVLSTPVLEFIHQFICLSQHPDMIFEKTQKSFNQFQTSTFYHSEVWNTKCSLSLLKN
jgi:hypothetical protein